jgi:hypothetical protein
MALLVLLLLLHLCQAALTLYTFRFSYASISLLSGGDTAQKVARYSNKAALRVFHSKGTMTAGVTSLATSFLLSLFLAASAALSTDHNSPGRSTLSQATRVALNLGEAGLIAGSVAYIRNFWKARAKVPLERAQEYNQAITLTNKLSVHMGYLGGLWGVTTGLEVCCLVLSS